MTHVRRARYMYQSKPVSSIVTKTIKSFSEERRNTIRGAIADARRGHLGSIQIDIFRNNTTEADMVAAATIFELPSGLRRRSVEGLVQKDLWAMHNLTVKRASLEAAYACGYLNAWKEEAIKATETIALLSRIANVSPNDAINAIYVAVQTWGSSNYISRKIAYVKEFFLLDENGRRRIDQIDDILENRKSPMLQYSALENIKERISLFSIARRHTNVLADRVSDDFRRSHSLNNLVSTPFNQDDCGGFLLRAVETSLIDVAFSFWILLNFKTRFPDVAQVIERNLSSEILSCLLRYLDEIDSIDIPDLLSSTNISAEQKKEGGNELEYDFLSLYRRSSVFLEYPKLCLYRNDIDKVIGYRFISPLLSESNKWHCDSFYDVEILKSPKSQFDLALHHTEKAKVDVFYRTYLFLRFIQDQYNLALLTGIDVEYIFNNTVGLESLLLENELKTMHINASEDARAIISVLALALYRSKSSDPDIDFDFRSTLEDYILKNFHGDIGSFIDNLAPKNPEIANYLASSLDEVTLQKMYSIINSPGAAENARREILTSVGIHLNKIEYIVEAEAIETRSKVSKLKQYFDASCMYVDLVAMKKWFSSNPSAYSEQYKELLPENYCPFSGVKKHCSARREGNKN